MAQAKKYIYNCTKQLGIIGDANKKHKVVELGHYTVDGTTYADKVYVWNYYFNPEGELIRSNRVGESVSIELANFIKEVM